MSKSILKVWPLLEFIKKVDQRKQEKFVTALFSTKDIDLTQAFSELGNINNKNRRRGNGTPVGRPADLCM